MAELKYLKEYLSTEDATEGSLLIVKKIFDTLILEQEKALIPRSEAAIVFGPGDIPGSSIDVDLVTENTQDIRLVSEGAEIPLDEAEYTSINLKPLKYGVAIRITNELMEDSKWNLLEHNTKTAGQRLAENETSLILTAMAGAANTISGGAAATIANITRALQYLDDADYEGTTLLVGNEFLQDLRNIDTFVEANKSGSTEMLATGFKGVIYGLNVLRFSTNAAPSTTYSLYGYVYDRTKAYAIAEKRPISIQNFDLPTYDMSGAVITQRIAVELLRSSAVCKITTS